MLNKIILIGRQVKPAELRYLPGNGTAVANFTLAVNRKFNKEESDFIEIQCWRQTAEFVSNYGDKGRLVMVEGRLQLRTYETKEGQKRKVAEVIADDVRFLDGKKSGDKPATNSAQTGFEDIGREVRLEDIGMGEDSGEIPF